MIADGLSRIAMSSGLATSLSRATDYARAHGHAEVTLEHMLLALCDDPDAILVLAASNVNVEELTSEVTTQLAALPSRPHATDVEFAVAADMRRILEAAAAAARGGRRREINGAIVLAAIVGDGKSAAAQVLSALGLTFEGAIRALQSKPAPAAEQRQLPAPDAEAILASARERVQSRTGVAPRRVPMDDEGDYEDVAEPLQVQQARALPPPAYEPEPLEPEPHQEQLTGAPNYHQYEPAPSYEPEAEPAFEPARAAGSDH
jgi:antitoxin component of RelBE/YafQ-DinJ toxin-antitoxin module